MKRCQIRSTILVAWIAIFPHVATAQTDRLWDGGSSQGSNWSTSVLLIFNGYNWNPNGNPIAGDNLLFGETSGGKTSPNNNYASGTEFNNIAFVSGAPSFHLTGNQLTLTGSVSNNSASPQTISLPVSLANGTHTIATNAGDIIINGNITGTGSLEKAGAYTLTLTGVNTYTGSTTISDGTLNVTGSLTASGGIIVAPGAILTGNGSVEAITTIQGNHNAGGVGTHGSQTFSNDIIYADDSIFSWEVSQSGAYDKVVVDGTVSGSALFEIVLGSGENFSDAFWNTNRSWNDIFITAPGSSSLASIFSSFSGTDVSSSGLVSGQGQFSFNGNSLDWTAYSAAPEPTCALAGLLIAAGMLRRRRTARA